jgi:hypothetical protein
MDYATERPQTGPQSSTRTLFGRACAKAREQGAAWLSSHLKAAGVTCLSEMSNGQLRTILA